jgi:hypothetical protein
MQKCCALAEVVFGQFVTKMGVKYFEQGTNLKLLFTLGRRIHSKYCRKKTPEMWEFWRRKIEVLASEWVQKECIKIEYQQRECTIDFGYWECLCEDGAQELRKDQLPRRKKLGLIFYNESRKITNDWTKFSLGMRAGFFNMTLRQSKRACKENF